MLKYVSALLLEPKSVIGFRNLQPQIRTLLTHNGKINLRAFIRDFYKTVHPDLTSFESNQAKLVNERSLSELNSYIDLLEQSLIRSDLEEIVIPGRTLNFFKPYKSFTGKVYPERCHPFSIFLPKLGSQASFKEKENIALCVIYNLRNSISSIDSQFSSSPAPKPIFSSKNGDRKKLSELWKQMTYDTILKKSLYEQDTPLLRIKNKKDSRQTLGRNGKQHQQAIGSYFNNAWSNDEAAIIEAGYHPDLIFYDKFLGTTELEEAKERLKGLYLTNEADLWLLSNTLKILRTSNPPFCMIICPRNSNYGSTQFGTLMIPSNFDLWEFVDYLENNLDSIKAKRDKVFRELKAA